MGSAWRRIKLVSPATAVELAFHLRSFFRLLYVPVKRAWWFPASWLHDRAASACLNHQNFGAQGEKSGFF
ncbi:hypothetical protein [Endozoicomonas atrinae]|uniref:hypothetical protein n=1 Tax=Endozoicomonas atrinae TaxID=1333660 RepID=UPI003B00F79D